MQKLWDCQFQDAVMLATVIHQILPLKRTVAKDNVTELVLFAHTSFWNTESKTNMARFNLGKVIDMNVGDDPYADLKTGDRVISCVGKHGIIAALYPDYIRNEG
jgi:hypothetical protein